MRNFVIIFSLSLALGIASATDYCKKSCGNTKNLGCDNNGAWASSCPSDATLLTLSSAQKDALVARTNDYRNHIAGGLNANLSAACRMATIKWNDELAYLASLNVKSCQMKHDGCHNTDAFDWSGQNLAWMGYYNPLNVTHYLEWGVDMWYDEAVYTKQAYIDAYPSNYNGPAIGHFTVLVADRNTEVGCAAATYSVPGQSYKAFLLACNYAATNVLGIKMYSYCSKAASKCTTGTNPKYKYLCSANEKYNVNNLSY
ncbi:antigen 5 like allergen Cul n 1 [Drosophila sechellia]|uniref:Venom allergen-1 n=1 Tax=Drosophila sechellia TaxID=7238 RepID=B4IJ58_DROSE|nr:antigen 5 like allergen Cul n 1 [Drosophila sechellia]EDW51037.1 GM12039 [Drosophila sechellia]